MEDTYYDELLYFLRTKNYPTSITSVKCPTTKKDLKKKLRSKCKILHVRDGFLMKSRQRLLRKNEVISVMENMHAGKYSGGHLGRDKTYHKINTHYFWKGMKEQIKDFIRDCDVCTRVNIAPPKSAPPLNSIPVPSKVWSLIGIDIIGPLETTDRGNKYIVAATDHFSKYAIAEAIPQKTAENVAKFLISAICTFGPMDSIITDQGKEFTNKVLNEITTELDIDHRISSSYHPQTNGQRERDNRTLKEMLQKVTSKNGKDWDLKLQSSLFAYRTSLHASTKYTPFEVMFGREARLVNVPDKPLYKHDITRVLLEDLQESRETVNASVSHNITCAQKRQKKYYDERNGSHKVIAPGTHVLIKNASKIRRFGSKLAPRWLGPYLVVESLTKGRVRLQNLSSGKVLSNVYHSSNVKSYTAAFKSSTSESKPKTKTVDRPVKRLQKKSLKKLRSDEKQQTPKRKLPVYNKFSPLSTTENQELCELLEIPFVKRPRYGTAGIAREPEIVKHIQGDGNCFFRAVSYAVSGSESAYKQCRNKIVSHMGSNVVSKHLEGYLNEKTSTYLKNSRMMNNAVWATDAEIMGAASLFNTDIYVYAASGTENGSPKYVWLRYPAGFSLGKITKKGLYLKNIREHFEVVLKC